jgi:hypothetical protein
VRRAEDARAVARLGAEALVWSLPDAIYRLHPATGEPLYTDNDQLFGQLSPAEAPLVAELAAQMGALPPAGRIVAPLVLGNHVDHQLVRAAAEKAFASLYYYEDYPYVQRHPASLADMLHPQRAGNLSCTRWTKRRLLPASRPSAPTNHRCGFSSTGRKQWPASCASRS